MGGGDLSIINCDITDNDAVNQGGGIFISTSGSLTITLCLINDNSSGETGGGITTKSADALWISHSEIRGNSTGGNGGGVHFFPSFGIGSLTFLNTLIAENTATSGSGAGGGILANACHLSLINSY